MIIHDSADFETMLDLSFLYSNVFLLCSNSLMKTISYFYMPVPLCTKQRYWFSVWPAQNMGCVSCCTGWVAPIPADCPPGYKLEEGLPRKVEAVIAAYQCQWS